MAAVAPPVQPSMMEEAAPSVTTSLDIWDLVPDNDDESGSPSASELAHWQKKARNEERLRRMAEAEVKDWQERAAEESNQREEAKAALVKWKSRAEQAESRAEQAELSCQKQESWSKSWKEKVEMEESLREHWQRMAKEQENSRQHEASLREEASAAAAEWKRKAKAAEAELQSTVERLQEQVEQFRKQVQETEGVKKEIEEKANVAEKKWQGKAEQLEEDIKKWKKLVDEKESLRRKNEEEAEARIQEIQDDAIKAAMGLGQRCPVTYAFKGVKAARKADKELRSPELTFQLIEHPSLSYSFMLRLYPNGLGDANKGTVHLSWVPRVGSQAPGSLTWPIPHEKVKIALRILSFSAGGSGGAKQRKVKEWVLDGAKDEGARALLAKHAPPSKDNIGGVGFLQHLTKAEIEQGGWTMGPDDDIMVVQAELILK